MFKVGDIVQLKANSKNPYGYVIDISKHNDDIKVQWFDDSICWATEDYLINLTEKEREENHVRISNRRYG